jgi:hypothetical protein
MVLSSVGTLPNENLALSSALLAARRHFAPELTGKPEVIPAESRHYFRVADYSPSDQPLLGL